MDLDRQHHQLRFDSAEELEAFHRELTALLREVTLGATTSTRDAGEARERAHEVLREFAVVAALLNALRAPHP